MGQGQQGHLKTYFRNFPHAALSRREFTETTSQVSLVSLPAERGKAMTQNTDPTVQTYAMPDSYGLSWVLYVQCPHCGDVHTHGGGSLDGPPDMGHRVSHCVHADSQGYVLVPGPPDMAMPKALSARERRKRLHAYDHKRDVEASRRTLAYLGVGS
jgi:hypothetical protein